MNKVSEVIRLASDAYSKVEQILDKPKPWFTSQYDWSCFHNIHSSCRQLLNLIDELTTKNTQLLADHDRAYKVAEAQAHIIVDDNQRIIALESKVKRYEEELDKLSNSLDRVKTLSLNINIAVNEMRKEFS